MKAINGFVKATILLFVVYLCMFSIEGYGKVPENSGADTQESGVKSSVEIFKALENGNLTKVKSMLAEKPDLINAKDTYGHALLYMAVERGNKEIVQLLIAKGADVNAKEDNPLGLAPLHVAAFKNYKEVAELLLAAGAEVNIKESSGKTALHGAAYHGQKEMVELLISAGAEINVIDNDMKTALDYAVGQKHREIIDLLLKHEAKNGPISIPVVTSGQEDILKTAKQLFGNTVTKAEQKEVSALVSKLCKPYGFYSVIVPSERVIAGDDPNYTYLMALDKQAFKLRDTKEVATFLTSLNKSVTGELDVLERALVFSELISKTVQTHMPKRKSLLSEYMEQKTEDWPLIISGTDSGWTIQITLMATQYPTFESCTRYSLKISKEGEILVTSEKSVYSYTARE